MSLFSNQTQHISVLVCSPVSFTRCLMNCSIPQHIQSRAEECRRSSLHPIPLPEKPQLISSVSLGKNTRHDFFSLCQCMFFPQESSCYLRAVRFESAATAVLAECAWDALKAHTSGRSVRISPQQNKNRLPSQRK